MNKIDKLIEYINNSKNMVFFCGAGISTESGLKDFRSKDGLYNEVYEYNPEVILSHSFFINKTEEFYKFYKDKLNSLKYMPNITHKVLKKLEDKGLLKAVITQNIDGFEEQVGINNLYELHGSIKRNYCMNCNKFYDAKYIFNSKGVPKCNCGGTIKPDVVLYEESLNNDTLSKAINKISNADLLIIGGTSLNVYPAASLINYFKGKYIVIINKDKTMKDNIATLVINDSIGKVFEKINKKL